MVHKTCGRRKETRVELTQDADDDDNCATSSRRSARAIKSGRRKSILSIEDMAKAGGVSF